MLLSRMPALLVALSLLACKPDTVARRPADVLPPEKMVSIQAGIHQVEAELSIRRMDQPVAKPIFERRLDSILRTQGTDTAAYRRSFIWYAQNVEEMDKVYAAVVDTLSLRESRLMSKPAQQPPPAQERKLPLQGQ